MAIKAKTENKPVVFANFNFKKCAEVNPYLNEAVFTVSDDGWRIYIPKFDIEFTDKPTILRIIHSGLRSIVSDYNANKGDAVPEHIVKQLSVWKEFGTYLTPKEKDKASKPVTLTASGKPAKAAYGRVEIEGALRDVHGLDDKRVAVVEAFSDEKFKRFMETMKDDQFVIDAITHLNEKAVKAAELQAEKDKAEFEALFGSLGE